MVNASFSQPISQPVPVSSPSAYWENRAQRFAVHGAGLAAVCSYGMPAFYNAHIDWLQRRALAPWLTPRPGTTMLEIGCGVGRWTLPLARAGVQVTGVDLSLTMIGEARRRATHDGLSGRCRFLVGDAAELDFAEQFDLILSVTVLQHVLDPQRFAGTLNRLAAHLNVGGRMILVEAAPSKPIARCDSTIFVAREESAYHRAFEQAGLRSVAVRGIDPAPFKTWFLPWYRRIPAPLANAALLGITALSLPIDAIGARWLTRQSWHKLFVLERFVETPVER